MEEVINNTLQIGDYVENIAGKKEYTGIVVSFYEENPYWPSILNLDTQMISHPIHSNCLYKTDLPERYKILYNLLKVNNFSFNLADYLNFKVQLETHFGCEVWTNPIMDKLRKIHCLCLNCANMKDCPTAHELYEICKKEDMAMGITRCRSFKGKE